MRTSWVLCRYHFLFQFRKTENVKTFHNFFNIYFSFFFSTIWKRVFRFWRPIRALFNCFNIFVAEKKLLKKLRNHAYLKKNKIFMQNRFLEPIFLKQLNKKTVLFHSVPKLYENNALERRTAKNSSEIVHTVYGSLANWKPVKLQNFPTITIDLTTYL